jgi:hypothetical protein
MTVATHECCLGAFAGADRCLGGAAVAATMHQLRYVGEWHSHPERASAMPGHSNAARSATLRGTPASLLGKATLDPKVWSGRASQEVSIDLSVLRSCINVSGLLLERTVLRAIMDISAPAFSLADRPRMGR